MTLFEKDGQIAIGSRLPYTSDFYFCIEKRAVAKSWQQLHAEGWRVIKSVLPE